MGVNWNQLGSMFSNMSLGLAPQGTPMQRYAAQQADDYSARMYADAVRKQQKEEEEKKKAGLFGKIGSTLGTIGGVALAPLTGGASLAIPAALGAAGGAIGGAAGRAIGGGEFDPRQFMMDAAQGGLGGYLGGQFGGFGKAGAAVNPGTMDTSARAMLGPAIGKSVAGATGPTMGGMAMGGMQGVMAASGIGSIIQTGPNRYKWVRNDQPSIGMWPGYEQQYGYGLGG